MERVVITGLGLVTALGTDVDASWRTLVAGEGAVTAPLRHGADEPATRAVGEVAPAVIAALRARHPELSAETETRTLFGHAAACAAYAQAGLTGPSDDAGVVLGSGPGVHRLEDVAAAMAPDGDVPRGQYLRAPAHPGSLVRVAPTAPAESAAAHLGIGGPVHAVTTACSASNHALGMGLRLVRDGECPFVLAGGSDSMIDPLGLVFFVLPGASANVDGDPADACKPFDRRRSGLVMGEAAGCVVLESLSHATARGATILAEFVGFGSSFDAYRVTAPRWTAQALPPRWRRPWQTATWPPPTWTTCTPTARAPNATTPPKSRQSAPSSERTPTRSPSPPPRALSDTPSRAPPPWRSCWPSRRIQEDTVPPTRNLTQPDPQCDLDFVPGVGQARRVRAALNNSFAFGGQNAVTALRKYESEA